MGYDTFLDLRINTAASPNKEPEVMFGLEDERYIWKVARIRAKKNAHDFGGSLVIETSAPGEKATNATVERLRIDAQGNVGIGTPQPQNRLDVAGSLVIGADYAGQQSAPPNGLLVQGEASIHGSLKLQNGVAVTGVSNDSLGDKPDSVPTEHAVKQYVDDKVGLQWDNDGEGNLWYGKGNVGIGTDKPDARLDIINMGQNKWLRLGDGGDDGRLWVTYHRWKEKDQEKDKGAPLLVMSDYDDPPRIRFQQTGGPEHNHRSEDDPEHVSWIGHARGKSSDLALMGGNVGIGTLKPQATLHVNGEAKKPGGGAWTADSDAAYKQHIGSLEGALVKLLRLHGVTFEWKDPALQGNLTGVQMGLIAQEVEPVFPEWVGTNPDGYKNLTIRGFEALVVEAFREIMAEITTVKQQMQVAVAR